MTDPRFESALEQFLEAQQQSRRRFLGRAGGSRVRRLRAVRRARRLRRRRGHAGEGQGGQRRQGRDGQPPEDRDRRLDVLQLAALHGQEDAQAVRQEVRRQGQVHRGHQRQLRVLREGPPAARERPADRPRHRRADRLHGLALDPQRLRRADRQEQRPERVKNLVDNLASINYDPERKYSLPYQSGATGIGYNIKKTGRELKLGQGPLRPEVQGPRDDAVGAVRLGAHGAARRRGRLLEGHARPAARRDREDRQGQPGRPVPALHRQRLHDRPRQGERVASSLGLVGRPGAAPERQPGPALHVLRGGQRRRSTTT